MRKKSLLLKDTWIPVISTSPSMGIWTFSSVNDLCFHKLCPVGIYMDHHIRGFDLHAAGIGNIGSHEMCFLGSGLIAGIKGFQLFILHTAFLKRAVLLPALSVQPVPENLLRFYPFI